jgi:hypothetical protein
MIKRFITHLCRLDEDGQIFPNPVLPDHLVQEAGSDGQITIIFFTPIG